MKGIKERRLRGMRGGRIGNDNREGMNRMVRDWGRRGGGNCGLVVGRSLWVLMVGMGRGGSGVVKLIRLMEGIRIMRKGIVRRRVMVVGVGVLK